MHTLRRAPKRDRSAMKVGIFWYFRGHVIGRAVSHTKGVDTGDFLDSPINHYEYWPTLKSARRVLADLDYIDVPRGRALLRKKDKRLVVYMDKLLFNPEARRQIANFFAVTKPLPVFRRDEHYTTCEEDLKRIFST